MAEDDKVSKAEFVQYVKGVNGDLNDIKIAVATLTDKMDHRFDSLDAKFESERVVSRESNQRIHQRIDAVGEGQIGKGMAIFIAFLSSLTLASMAVVVTVVIK